MDPSKAQADQNNDARSLEKDTGEHTDEPKHQETDSQAEAPKTKDGVIDASSNTPTEQPPHDDDEKQNIFVRIWRKFNVFLLLFILLVAIAIGTVVALVVKDSQANAPKDDVASQELSDIALSELANTTTTVGEPQHILNVQSHAIFSGNVLVRGDVEVAGAIKVGAGVELPSITVSGASRFSQLQTDDLEINGTTSAQGAIIARSGIQVAGNSSFDGNVSAASIATDALQLSGDLSIKAHITVSGSAPSLSKGSALGAGGTASVNGTDTAGSITINTGGSPPTGCFVTINFTKSFSKTPHVVISPVGAAAGGLNYYINRSSDSFSVCSANSPPAGQNFGFDYWVAG